MSLEAAIAKITTLPASILGLRDRGRIALGNRADITIFDHEKIEDHSVYTNSMCKPAGVNYVIIDGKVAFAEGEQVGNNFGKVILHE